MANQFQDLSEDDFVEVATAPAGTNPATGKTFTAPEMLEAVVGKPSAAAEIEPSFIRRMMAGAGLGFENKLAGMQGKPAPEDFGLSDDTAGSIGAILPEAFGSMLVRATVPAQMAYGAASRAMDPADNMLDRGVNALKGAAEFGLGQGLTNVAVRGANAAAGDLTRAGQVANAARLNGLNLSAGDIADSKVLRLAEEKAFKSPSAGQVDDITALMTDPAKNPIRNAVMSAYEGAQGRVSAAAADLDAILAQGNLPPVTPRNTYSAIQEIAKRSPDTINNVRDPVIREKLEAIATYPAGRIPKGMSFAELDEMRKVLGPIMAKVEMQAQSGASNINRADANRWKQLYKGLMTDIEGWGSKKATEEALAAHKIVSDTFKTEVLPLREHPIARKYIDDLYEKPELMVRDLMLPSNKSILKDLHGRLDQGGKNALDAFLLAKRGTKEFAYGEPKVTGFDKPLAYGALGLAATSGIPTVGAVLPWLAGGLATEQALVHGLNSQLGKRIISGSPRAAKNELADRAIQAGLRTAGTQSALEQVRSRTSSQ